MRRCSIFVVIAIIQFAASVPIDSDDSQVSSYEGPGEGLGYEAEEDLRRLHDDNLDYDILQDELGRRKRFGKRTVDFMGMQVSMPQYLRLVALQEKVIQLDKILRKMKQYKTEEELAQLPQWQRLVSLHGSLKKLLPEDYSQFEKMEDPGDVQREPIRPFKRSSMEFNGVQVSLPQYYRLMELQEKVMKLDAVMRKLEEDVSPEKLESSGKWNKLVSMRQSLQKLLPQAHPEFSKRSTDFNGVQVSYPQYLHLMNLQKKVLALDATMKKISAASPDKTSLQSNPTWQKLVDLRGSLSRLLPNADGTLTN